LFSKIGLSQKLSIFLRKHLKDMKLFNRITALLSFIVLFSCGPTDNRKSFTDVTEYNDFIIDNINLIDQLYVTTLDDKSGREYCLAQCDSLIIQSEKTIELLNGIQPYDGDSSLAMAAKGFCIYMGAIGKKDLPEFINIALNPNITVDDLPKMNSEAKKLDENYEIQMNKIETIQKALSKKFNYTVK